MINLNQISIELKYTLVNWNFTNSIEFFAFFELIQFPTFAKFFNIGFVDLFILIGCLSSHRFIFLLGFFLQLFCIIIVNITHPLIDCIFIVCLFIFGCGYLIIVRVLFENQSSRNHCINNGIGQGRYQENRHN